MAQDVPGAAKPADKEPGKAPSVKVPGFPEPVTPGGEPAKTPAAAIWNHLKDLCRTDRDLHGAFPAEHTIQGDEIHWYLFVEAESANEQSARLAKEIAKLSAEQKVKSEIKQIYKLPLRQAVEDTRKRLRKHFGRNSALDGAYYSANTYIKPGTDVIQIDIVPFGVLDTDEKMASCWLERRRSTVKREFLNAKRELTSFAYIEGENGTRQKLPENLDFSVIDSKLHYRFTGPAPTDTIENLRRDVFADPSLNGVWVDVSPYYNYDLKFHKWAVWLVVDTANQAVQMPKLEKLLKYWLKEYTIHEVIELPLSTLVSNVQDQLNGTLERIQCKVAGAYYMPANADFTPAIASTSIEDDLQIRFYGDVANAEEQALVGQAIRTGITADRRWRDYRATLPPVGPMVDLSDPANCNPDENDEPEDAAGAGAADGAGAAPGAATEPETPAIIKTPRPLEMPATAKMVRIFAPSEQFLADLNAVQNCLNQEAGSQGALAWLHECRDHLTKLKKYDAAIILGQQVATGPAGWGGAAQKPITRERITELLGEAKQTIHLHSVKYAPFKSVLNDIELYSEAIKKYSGSYVDKAVFNWPAELPPPPDPGTPPTALVATLSVFGRLSSADQKDAYVQLIERQFTRHAIWKKAAPGGIVVNADGLEVVGKSVTRATDFFAAGLKHFWLRQYEAAAAEFKRASLNSPSVAAYRHWRILCYVVAGDVKRAYSHMLAAVICDPETQQRDRVAVSLARVQGPARHVVLGLQARALREYYLMRNRHLALTAR